MEIYLTTDMNFGGLVEMVPCLKSMGVKQKVAAF